MPLFFWALALTPQPNPWRSLAVFVIFHGLLYPASNGYNSAIDQDTEAIGGLAHPPAPPALLAPLTAVMDALALGWSLYLNPYFGLGIGFLILMSRLYSAPWPRLKQYPILSFVLVSSLQGYFTFSCLYVGLHHLLLPDQDPVVIGAALTSTLLVGAAYPLSQIFQHAADAKRGDFTLSRQLGYQGTFVFSEVLLLMAVGTCYLSQPLKHTLLFIICMLPAWLYLLFWHWQVYKDTTKANFTHSFRLNILWALGLNICFLWLLFDALLA